MAVTPNYSWPVPVATDLVKDGYAQIADLGDAIDATVFGLPKSGLTLIKTQVMGSLVSSVTVTGAFSSTYDNYKIIISGGGSSAASNMTMILGATTTGYYWANRGNNWANTGFQSAGSNLSSWGEIARAETSAITANIELESPFLADETVMRNATVGVITSGFMQYGGGFLNNTTSYTSFTVAPSTGTYSGATIYVYGYQK